MKIAHIVGARPQFIKAAMVSRTLRDAGMDEIIIHTGQHYDDSMSTVFFDELGLPRPAYHFTVETASSAAQTGEMVASIEACLQREQPGLVLVHGDTNSTLAGALAANNLGIPLAHNEAGLRSFNRNMPEEHNRVITDHCSSLLFCPTERSREQLLNEGLHDRAIYVTGDVMYDAALHYGKTKGNTLPEGIRGPYALLTVHRAYTVDSKDRLQQLVEVMENITLPIVFPVHPRTQRAMDSMGIVLPDNVAVIGPVGYFDMLALEQHAEWILTDSGGVQKEAYIFGVPCITLRPETEWQETVEAGWNIVTDLETDRIVRAMQTFDRNRARPALFGDGHAAAQIATIISHTHFHEEA